MVARLRRGKPGIVTMAGALANVTGATLAAMPVEWRERILLIGLTLFAAGVFVTGIGWGLPSRAADTSLFGHRTPWDGAKILALAGGWDAGARRGADVDRTPLVPDGRPMPLNDTDIQRAEIVRRYRLYSYQPDEMITFRALAQMEPSRLRLDPKLYQYGGLWVYPVGGLLKAASMAGLVRVSGDLSHYLDRPEDFGRFYIVARAYGAAWGVVAVWAVYALARRAGAPVKVATVGAACFAVMPVVVNLSHEAKPHLAGCALMLLAVLAGSRFVASGRFRDAAWMGAACGAALGMVLSSLPIFIVIPLAAWLGHGPARRRMAGAILGLAVGGATYAVTNPYVAINFITGRDVLQSNLSNSAAMYQVGRWSEGLVRAAELILAGSSAMVCLAGICESIVVVLVRRDRRHALLLAPAFIMLVQFTALAAGKPAEYARFALFIDAALLLLAIVGLTALIRALPKTGAICMAAVFLLTAWHGGQYLRAFVLDSREVTSRLLLARTLANVEGDLSLCAEPAPYSCPPVNLFDRTLFLVRDGAALPGTTFVCVVDVPGDQPPWLPDTPITWANKPFEVRRTE